MKNAKTLLGVLLSMIGAAGVIFGFLALFVNVVALRNNSGPMWTLDVSPWVLPAGLLFVWGGFILRTTPKEAQDAFGCDARIRLAQIALPAWMAEPENLFIAIFQMISAVATVGLLGAVMQVWEPDWLGLMQFLLWSPFILGALYIMVFAHELGHLVVGKGVGMKPVGMKIGHGERLCIMQTNRLFVEIGANPMSGLAYIYPLTERFHRTRSALMILGGPAFHAAAITLFAFGYIQGFGPGEGRLMGALALSQGVLLIVFSLIPSVHLTSHGNLPNDSYLLCGMLHFPAGRIPHAVAHSKMSLALQPSQSGRPEESLLLLLRIAADYPDYPLLRCYIAQLAWLVKEWEIAELNYALARQLGNLESDASCMLEAMELASGAMLEKKEVRRRCLAILESSRPVGEKTTLLDMLACLPFTAELQSYLPDADEWSLRTLELAPGSLTLQGTRGAILVELGRYEEARQILEKVKEESAAPIDQGISNLFLAVIEMKSGNRSRAESLLAEAAAKHPEPWLFRRVARLSQDLSAMSPLGDATQM